MFRRSEKIWKYFPQNILASNKTDASRLNQFLLHINHTKGYLYFMEILDFQRYRLIRKKSLISKVLSLPENKMTFLFPFYKN